MEIISPIIIFFWCRIENGCILFFSIFAFLFYPLKNDERFISAYSLKLADSHLAKIEDRLEENYN